jgi:hypothetical protein
MEIASGLTDFQNRVHLDRISKSVRDLRSTDINTRHFVRQMMSLSTLLESFDRRLDRSFSVIDKNSQDPTYFIAAYFDTRNVSKAVLVYRIVRSLTRIILLSDKFYETGNKKYSLLAKQVQESLYEFLRSKPKLRNLIYSIEYWLEQFSAFWQFERCIRHRMIRNSTFSFNEIRHFNLSKSSDALLVYSKVLDAMLPNFNENVALLLHYNQALLDILDDWEDIEDDVEEDMPNTFILAAVGNIPYGKIKKSSQDIIRKVVLNGANSSKGPISRLINELQTSSKNVSIPANFAFLKSLSDRYADTLRRTVSLPNS